MERVKKSRIGPWLGGVDEKTAAYGLPVGKLAGGQNVLLDEKPGRTTKRPGSLALSTLPSGNPARDGYEFKTSDGSAYLLASDGENLYYTVDPAVQGNWTLLKGSLNADGFMEFETAHGQVWMSNGIDDVMSWDGSTLSVYDREKEVTIDNSAVTGTTVQNTQLTEADDYWNGQKLVFTTGANMGTVVTVTDFVAATDTITFTPAVSGAAVTDRFKVGLVIPKGKTLRFWDGHLWDGGTDSNESEVRFDRLADPNTGASITPDHPLAWPAEYQLEVYADDGDAVSGLSPVLRDRILVAKSTGLFRIERHPLTMYRIEVVTRAIGSRFPRSWAIKNDLLYFVGQDKDGLPEVYKTDMVDVTPVDPVGGMEPTIRDLRQPNTSYRSTIFNSAASFGTGEKSTGLKTSGGLLEIDGIKSDAWAAYKSKSNILIGADKVSLASVPDWAVAYEGATIPTADPDFPWTDGGSGPAEAVSSGILSLTGIAAAYRRRRSGVLTASKDAFLQVKARENNAQDGFHFGLWNGAFGVYVTLAKNGSATKSIFVNGVELGALDYTAYKTFNLLLRSDGSWKLWIGGTMTYSGTAGATALNKVQFGWSGNILSDPLINEDGVGRPTPITAGNAATAAMDVDFVRYHADVPGSEIPNDLVTAGNLVVQFDYTRAPDALRRLYAVATLAGGAVSLESWTSTSDDFTAGNDPAGYVAVAQGAVPTSQVKQHHRVRITLTPVSYDDTMTVTQLLNGVLWLSDPVFIGPTISEFRTFLDEVTKPAGTDQEIKIREATILTTPVEADWAAFQTITGGDDIGTILSESDPPVGRWVQLKIEQGPSSGGDVPSVSSAVIQWAEGSNVLLPLMAVVHKKRYLFCGATGDAEANDIILVSDRNEAWMKWVGLNLNALIHFRGRLVGFSSTDDKILDIDSDVLSDQGEAIDAFIITREETLDAEELRKDLKYSYLHLDDVAGDVEVAIKRPVDADWVLSKTLSADGSSSDVRCNFPVGTAAKRLQRRYRNNQVGQDLAVRGETFYFTIRGPQP